MRDLKVIGWGWVWTICNWNLNIYLRWCRVMYIVQMYHVYIWFCLFTYTFSFHVALTEQFAIDMATVLTIAVTDQTSFSFASDLTVDKLPPKSEMLENCWRYKYDKGKFADVAMIIKMAAQDIFVNMGKEIGDRQTVEENCTVVQLKLITRIRTERRYCKNKLSCCLISITVTAPLSPIRRWNARSRSVKDNSWPVIVITISQTWGAVSPWPASW